MLYKQNRSYRKELADMMDFFMVAALVLGTAVVGALVKWCDTQVEAKE